MTSRFSALAPATMLAAVFLAAPLAAQQASQVETVQIGEQSQSGASGAGKAYLDPPSPATPSPERRAQTASQQIPRQASSRETAQITPLGDQGSAMSQLSQAELEATLAQLSPRERRVLLDAINGSDICDNPPDVPAIRTLCRNRIETRASEFAEREAETISAEERLLRGGVDENGAPNVVQVIQRLSRPSAAVDDFDNQAIASVALAPPPAASDAEDDANALSGLPPGTEGIINAIINRLGGGTGGP